MKYQNCLLKPKNKQNIEQLVMMGDTTYFVLFKADFSNMLKIKGVLKYKCQHKFILFTQIEKQDNKRLVLSIKQKEEADSQFPQDGSSINLLGDVEELQLYFEDKQKCAQTKQFIDYNRSNGEQLRVKAMDRFLESQDILFVPREESKSK